MSGAITCSAHSINVSYRSRHSFPRRSPLAAFRSFKERYSWNTKVRAVTVRAIELSPKDSVEQLTLFDNVQHRMAMEKVQDAVEEIRGRFGKSAISYACLMGDLKMPTDGRDKVKIPGLINYEERLKERLNGKEGQKE